MLTAKKKITVREAVPQSTLLDRWTVVQEFFRTNLKMVIGVLVAVIAIVVIGLVWSAKSKSNEIEASRMLREAQQLYSQQQYKLAITGDKQAQIPGLQEIVQRYSGTPSGDLAALYLGNCYLYTDQFDKAIQAYDEASPSSDLLKSAVYSGKAAALEGKKNFAEAASLYEKAAGMYDNDFLSAARSFSAGRLYAMAGDKAKAKEMFDRVRDAETPRFARDIDRLTAQYGLE